MDIINTTECETAEELLSHLDRANPQWYPNDDSSNTPWVFRGQWKDWPLLPSAWWREGNRLKPLMDRLRDLPRDSGKASEWHVRTNAEIEAQLQFSELADAIGFDTVRDEAVYKLPMSPLKVGGLVTTHGPDGSLVDTSNSPLA